MHDHGRLGEGLGDVAHPAGVVEVNVGDHHPAEVTGAHAGSGERLDDGPRRGLGTGLDQGRLRPCDQEAGGEPLHPPEQGVELVQPRGDLLHGPAGYPTRGEALAGAQG